MGIENIILDVFESETVRVDYLNEGFLPMSPVLAFLTLKRNTLGKLRKAGKDVDSSLENDINTIKAKGALAKEQIRASVGKTSGKGKDATVYKLTREQMEVLSEIQEKYGNDIIDDVMLFRNNILAPYQLIKRMVKNNKTINATDKFGMTHAQFKAAVESGKNKIEKRAGHFDKEEMDQNKIKELSNSIDDLRQLAEDFKSNKVIKEYIVNRVLRNYHLDGSEFENVSLDDLKNTYNELKRNNKIIKRYLDPEDKLSINDTESALAAQNIVKRSLELRKGIVSQERNVKELKKYREAEDKRIVGESLNEERINPEADKKQFSFLMKGEKFNIALGKYMLRRRIIDEIHSNKANEARRLYLFIIREMIENATDRLKKMSESKSKNRTKIEFNDIERKIYKVRTSVGKEYSGNLDDYVQVIKDEDFGNPEYIKRPQKLVDAEKKIEAEIKKFERALKKELDPVDYAKLKKFRLINNLITVREMSSPDKLFKSPAELQAAYGSSKTSVEADTEEPEEPEETEEN